MGGCTARRLNLEKKDGAPRRNNKIHTSFGVFLVFFFFIKLRREGGRSVG